jgi:hypothetical protein
MNATAAQSARAQIPSLNASSKISRWKHRFIALSRRTPNAGLAFKGFAAAYAQTAHAAFPLMRQKAYAELQQT